mmetsp:Transcript_29462/g.83096  ORF Transcript_29462/g.83096 Transcript_29462/m.83096 type:complete len:344 (+) Transcript_29462:241-1272(+)|eukprot:CAMPEP_0117656450 /NCGR_PEP_ID=MMETSP0804-20121206/4811_1 /TAXON_ID=1074897 /ORGANISM="Tetraselmis astigmatica, Strain CCMP880" /LENGTH=343 /DNA_ID=CAMNT_0005462853 /DNA_START=201 /DNA_END=1232 /DNA_ORIENTATION=+
MSHEGPAPATGRYVMVAGLGAASAVAALTYCYRRKIGDVNWQFAERKVALTEHSPASLPLVWAESLARWLNRFGGMTKPDQDNFEVAQVSPPSRRHSDIDSAMSADGVDEEKSSALESLNSFDQTSRSFVEASGKHPKTDDDVSNVVEPAPEPCLGAQETDPNQYIYTGRDTVNSEDARGDQGSDALLSAAVPEPDFEPGQSCIPAQLLSIPEPDPVCIPCESPTSLPLMQVKYMSSSADSGAGAASPAKTTESPCENTPPDVLSCQKVQSVTEARKPNLLRRSLQRLSHTIHRRRPEADGRHQQPMTNKEKKKALSASLKNAVRKLKTGIHPPAKSTPRLTF